MARLAEDGLCCCEYLNADGERSHLLASFCNCEALDLIFDRCIRCSPIESSLMDRLHSTVLDRLRIPWKGGAVKVPMSVVFSIIIVPCFIVLAAMSWVATLVSYCLLLPCVVYTAHRRIRDSRVATAEDQDALWTSAKRRSAFHPSFLLSSLFWCYFFFMTHVINHLEINALESLTLHCLCAASLFCLFVTRDSSAPGFEPPPASEVDVIESGRAWRVCDECTKQVPAYASHCRTCNSCFLHRDHHCLWLDCCISASNDRWFVSGVLLGVVAQSYAALLAFTVVCRPRYLFHNWLLWPHDCTYAYASWQSALSMSTAYFLVVLSAVSGLVTVQQVVCIARGVKVRQWRRGRPAVASSAGNSVQRASLALCRAARNCFRFWFRVKS
ncbi:Palmitoyltransferase DHHC domain [Trinorchestia longiramus]|nr:Palmitoyltransferase DHHC domain [Trinorchestia longiramus]